MDDSDGDVVRLHYPVFLFLLLPLAACSGGDTSDGSPLQLGQRVYSAYCLSCHQSDGSGVPGIYPPLQQTEWVGGDKGRLIRIVLNGMSGAVEVKGDIYNNLMPGHAHLSDEQIAAVLTFVRQNFGNDASAVTPQAVEAVRGATNRSGVWSADELESQTGIPEHD